MNVIRTGQEDGGTLTVDFDPSTGFWTVVLTESYRWTSATGRSMASAFLGLANKMQEATK